jgi:GntR family transcriptional repressor for pyruvate dehydrogenase complex
MMQMFQPIRHARTAEEVAHQIESLILEGVLRTGEQLPGERELAEATGVSRPIVREAIKALEEAGILASRHGEGTFVADIIGTVFTPQVSALLSTHRKATLDYLEYRREVEAIAAAMAARRATTADRDLLRATMERMQEAYDRDDFEAEAKIDVEFHSLIGEIAHNLVLMHTLRSCYRLLSQGVFRNRSMLYSQPGGRAALLAQHKAIAQAILSGEEEKAAAASRAHIDHVARVLQEVEQTADRERVSQLRLAQRSGGRKEKQTSRKAAVAGSGA